MLDDAPVAVKLKLTLNQIDMKYADHDDFSLQSFIHPQQQIKNNQSRIPELSLIWFKNTGAFLLQIYNPK